MHVTREGQVRVGAQCRRSDPITSRRTFLVTLAGGMLGWPCVAEPQQAGKVARVGWLTAGSAGPLPASALEGFRDGLRDSGWVEGRNLIIETRHGPSEGSIEEQLNALARLAAELATLKVDVIFASPTQIGRAHV